MLHFNLSARGSALIHTGTRSWSIVSCRRHRSEHTTNRTAVTVTVAVTSPMLPTTSQLLNGITSIFPTPTMDLQTTAIRMHSQISLCTPPSITSYCSSHPSTPSNANPWLQTQACTSQSARSLLECSKRSMWRSRLGISTILNSGHICTSVPNQLAWICDSSMAIRSCFLVCWTLFHQYRSFWICSFVYAQLY